MSLAGEEHGRGQVPLGVMTYMMFSSLALVANKMVMDFVSAPALVFSIQILATITFIAFGRTFQVIQVDAFQWHTVVAFSPYIASFTMTLYTNGKALAVSNVETVIVFRACAPLLVSFLDWCFLGRELPNKRSLGALLGMIAGAIGYVLADSEFALAGIAAYKWVTLNLLGVVFEMTYGKGLLRGIAMESPVWGATMYTNVLSLVPMVILGLLTHESLDFHGTEVKHTRFVAWMLASCVLGVGISWSGWHCRNLVSATVYTILGVLCKLLSVALNMLLGKKHATPPGLAALCVTVIFSAVYQQAPLRAEVLQCEKVHETSSLLGAASCKELKPDEAKV